ncbi:right-handed parallel beta-helix repeat-containing protein [Pseudonocardia sp. CA-107938]|uniref:right-handed parallel beta-helix repeat-containing protein n=1 Tax=Pseudonocardia sp. CA-107938 TaxID=3240021 RepID=UPI003D93B209
MRPRSFGVAVLLAATLAGCAGPPPAATRPPDRAGPTPPVATVADCGTTGVSVVRDTAALTAAIAAARPGSVIALAPGTYGAVEVASAGSADAPITLCGPRDAVVDGGSTTDGYTVHVEDARYWTLRGFTVRGGQKGVMLDGAQHVVLDGLLVTGTGDEGVHLRRNSTDNVVRGLTVRDTGLRQAKFGEGIYIGSAESNWCELTDCRPDRSDRNVVEDNTISETTAESVDVKEGTTGGVVRGNTFDGAGMSAADAWVDVKGNGWTITGNRGTAAPTDGFQVHEITDGWGVDNTFSANTASVAADGYVVNVTRNADRNTVTCDNAAVGAAKGISRGRCR